MELDWLALMLVVDFQKVKVNFVEKLVAAMLREMEWTIVLIVMESVVVMEVSVLVALKNPYHLAMGKWLMKIVVDDPVVFLVVVEVDSKEAKKS